jgi:hypothetical protein
MTWKHGFIAGVGILALAAASPYIRLGRTACQWREVGRTLKCTTATQILMIAPARGVGDTSRAATAGGVGDTSRTARAAGVGDTSRAARIGIGDTSSVVRFVADCLKVSGVAGVGDTSYSLMKADGGGGHKEKMRCRWLRDGVACATAKGAVVVDTARLSRISSP